MDTTSQFKTLIRQTARTNPDDLDLLLHAVEKETRLGKIMSRLGVADRRFLADYIEELEDASSPSVAPRAYAGVNSPQVERAEPLLTKAAASSSDAQKMLEHFGAGSMEEFMSAVDLLKQKLGKKETPAAEVRDSAVDRLLAQRPPAAPAPEPAQPVDDGLGDVRALLVNYTQRGNVFVRKDAYRIIPLDGGTYGIQNPTGEVYDFVAEDLEEALVTLEGNLPFQPE